MRKKNKKNEKAGKQKPPECRCAKCGHLIKASPFTTDIQICKECGGGYERIVQSPEKLLKGKRVQSAELSDCSLNLLFNDGSKLMITACDGMGADGGWYNWTKVILQTKSGSITLING